MPAYLRKNTSEILREVLKKLQDHTPITSVSPGSVARAIAEAIVSEHGDMYEIMDFNMGLCTT
jgi:4-aminobutyrate aminotransferase-like enzyme